MINISIPSICIERVSNGYVISWKKKNSDSSGRSLDMYAVCFTEEELLKIIKNASEDLKILSD